jgi:hypothetical protein
MNQTSGKSSWIQRAAMAASIALLCGAGLDSTHFHAPPDAKAYLHKVKAAVEAIPLNIGPWQGQDGAPSLETVQMLHPNGIIERQYRNIDTQATVSFLFVDYEDARDSLGHYPPVCYPGQGWLMQSAVAKDWKLANMTIHGTEYTFGQDLFDSYGSEIVDDFFILPGATTARDMEAVKDAVANLDRRFYGVAQVQLVFPSAYSRQQREQIFSEILEQMEPVIGAIQDIGPTVAQTTEK